MMTSKKTESCIWLFTTNRLLLNYSNRFSLYFVLLIVSITERPVAIWAAGNQLFSRIYRIYRIADEPHTMRAETG